MKTHRIGKTNAFTLIEVLVVIAVVAVLVGLILPVLSLVRENGNTAQCMSNLRQIYGAVNLYAQDHANRLPQRFYSETDGTAEPVGYTELILPYIDSNSPPMYSKTAKKIYTCPSQNNRSYPLEPGYGMNWYYDNVNISLVSLPAETILLGETLGLNGIGSRRADRDNVDGDKGKLDITRHRGRANYAFFDGHISSLVYTDTRRSISNSQGGPAVDDWGKDFGNHSQLLPQ